MLHGKPVCSGRLEKTHLVLLGSETMHGVPPTCDGHCFYKTIVLHIDYMEKSTVSQIERTYRLQLVLSLCVELRVKIRIYNREYYFRLRLRVSYALAVNSPLHGQLLSHCHFQQNYSDTIPVPIRALSHVLAISRLRVRVPIQAQTTRQL